MPTCPSCHNDVAEGAKFCTFCGGLIPKTKASDADPLLGRIFARNFRIEKLLGVGGMGKVYKAVQLSLDKPVVLKVLHPHYTNDETLVHRFHREARAASRLNHPNSISIIDFGQDEDGTLFMAMEFLGGRDLFTMLQQDDPIAESRIAHVLMQVCSALADAHAQGVIHRDLKPENIMVEDRRGQRDFVKVLDFGIAKIQDGGGAKETRALTAAGMVCGTPEYMAPEQARGEELDPRTDIYALGVMMYQLVTAQLPFQADNAIGIVTKHIVEKPVPPRQAYPDRNISAELEAIILRCMVKKREERFQTVLELSEALAPIAARADGAPVRTAPPIAATAATEAGAELAPRTTGPVAGRADSLGSDAPAGAGRGRLFAIGGAAVGVAIIAVGAFLALRGNGVDAPQGADAGVVAVAGTADAASMAAAKVDAATAAQVVPDASVQLAIKDPEPDPDPDPDTGHAVKDPGESGTDPVEPGGGLDVADRARLKSLMDKGAARSGAGDHETALKHYLKALELAPRDPDVHQKLGMVYYSLGRKDDACKELSAVLKLKPGAPQQYKAFVNGYCGS
ncbi:MAG: protein kinase [Pseudomonadota bacterium]